MNKKIVLIVLAIIVLAGLYLFGGFNGNADGNLSVPASSQSDNSSAPTPPPIPN